MKNGWRNDPAWIAHYERKAAERFERRKEMVRFEMEMMRINDSIERSLRMRNDPPLAHLVSYE